MESLINEPFYSFLFLSAGVLCILLEVFVPSGGILGFLSVGTAIFGIYGLFHQGRVLLACSSILALGTLGYFTIRFGIRRLSFSGQLAAEALLPRQAEDAALLGREGRTCTALRPAGIAVFDGRKVDVVAQSAYIEADTRVRVIESSANRLVVTAILEDAPVDHPPGQSSPA